MNPPIVSNSGDEEHMLGHGFYNKHSHEQAKANTRGLPLIIQAINQIDLRRKPLKAALRWRYAFNTVGPEIGKEYTPAEIKTLPEKQRELLTTKPLTGEQIETLLTTAIQLRASAMEELGESRWWVHCW
jgi:hypothetical protein